MEPSTIFAIAAGAIIIFGRIINRIVERSNISTDNTAQDLELQDELDDERALPTHQNRSEEDSLTGSILTQFLAGKHYNEMNSESQQTVFTQRISTQKFASSSNATPKQKINKTQTKAQTQEQITECSVADDETLTSEILEDFDLKKAVILSEILKPKFDE